MCLGASMSGLWSHNSAILGCICVFVCQALPLCRYSEVMGLAVGRLMDKSIHVVKSAIQLLAAFIEHNPYSCKVNNTKKNPQCSCNSHIISPFP